MRAENILPSQLSDASNDNEKHESGLVRPQSPSAGRALQRVFHQEDLHKGIEEQTATVTFLMNHRRRSIFTHLCERPCDHVRGVARAMDISAPTAALHLGRLCEAGYVKKKHLGRKVIYRPGGMLQDADVDMVLALRMPASARLLKIISSDGDGGTRENELVSKLKAKQQNVNIWLGRLLGVKLLSREGTGPGIRYRISPYSMKVVERYRTAARDFADTILALLDADGLRPRKPRVNGTRLYVEITLPAGKERLRFECSPVAYLARVIK